MRAGDAISPFYDPMIAKLVVHGADRTAALAALGDALGETEIAGSTTNLAFLSALATDPDFASGDVDTGLIARKQDALTATPAPDERVVAQAVLVGSAVGRGQRAGCRRPVVDNGRLRAFPPARAASDAFPRRGGDRRLGRRPGGRSGRRASARQAAAHARSRPAGTGSALAWPRHDIQGAQSHTFAIPDPFERSEEAASKADTLRAPMPGLVKIVTAAKGDAVSKGQPLLVLEAMKMEHTIAAPHDGVLAEIVSEGAQVTDGTVLVRFAEASEGAAPAKA